MPSDFLCLQLAISTAPAGTDPQPNIEKTRIQKTFILLLYLWGPLTDPCLLIPAPRINIKGASARDLFSCL